jgi:hypothetical protein
MGIAVLLLWLHSKFFHGIRRGKMAAWRLNKNTGLIYRQQIVYVEALSAYNSTMVPCGAEDSKG